MTERAYTLTEIDDMRRYTQTIHGGSGTTTANIEDYLRTYMLGGVEPSALAARAKEVLAEREVMYAAARKRREEREARYVEATGDQKPVGADTKTTVGWVNRFNNWLSERSKARKVRSINGDN